MTGQRKYDQLCPLASTLDVIGSRWALLIVRELVLGPRRFSELEAGLESAAPDMITNRLRELDAAGVLARTDDRRYRLTDAGYGLTPAIRSLSEWAISQGDDFESAALGPKVDLVRRLMAVLAMRARTTSFGDVGTIALACEALTVHARHEAEHYVIFDPAEPSGDTAAVASVDFDGVGLAAFALGRAPLSSLIDDGLVVPSDRAVEGWLQRLDLTVPAGA